MVWGFIAATVAGSLLSSRAQSRAADSAANAQVESAELGIEEQRRQFDEVIRLLNPFIEASTGDNGSLQAQLDLIGLGGEEAQAAAIRSLEGSPQYEALLRSGEESILQNASATGGLRGGNTQRALGEFRPALLSSLINDQYNRLAGITQIGQASAAGQASAGIQTGSQISQLLQQQGAARAGGAIAQGQAQASMFNQIGQLALLGGMKVF